jgi:hypothetical protein
LREERLHFFGVGELERAEKEARGFERRSHVGTERFFPLLLMAVDNC